LVAGTFYDLQIVGGMGEMLFVCSSDLKTAFGPEIAVAAAARTVVSHISLTVQLFA
jgi:hypothetical protein